MKRLTAVLMGLAVLAACGGDPCAAGKSVFTGQYSSACLASSGGSGATPAAGVRYEVTGTGVAARIRFDTADSSSEDTNVKLPWSFQFAPEDGDPLYVSATTGAAGGSLVVSIISNGQVVKRTEARGAFALAVATSTCC